MECRMLDTARHGTALALFSPSSSSSRRERRIGQRPDQWSRALESINMSGFSTSTHLFYLVHKKMLAMDELRHDAAEGEPETLRAPLLPLLHRGGARVVVERLDGAALVQVRLARLEHKPAAAVALALQGGR
uniref:Uncharacterized protein n=1 Tax=Setaria viridis TaxID=4556 RepID=A0A4U6TNH6_SETVI|nr:hypothetical protein SEVIR_7G034600v2 [Setaria viridis]TKW02865.1 hypothetical protein SEVIR_7G034600v2 [Setaria viridis]